MMQFPLHDLHIHTNLSECSRDPLQTVENIVRYAAEHNIPTVGISNHVWDREIPGASDWYAPQDFDHILAIRRQIPSDLHGVRLLIGAETEFAGGKIALTRAHRDELDYVLVPHSHIHMVGLVLPRDRVTDRQVADYLVESFLDLLSLHSDASLACASINVQILSFLLELFDEYHGMDHQASLNRSHSAPIRTPARATRLRRRAGLRFSLLLSTLPICANCHTDRNPRRRNR